MSSFKDRFKDKISVVDKTGAQVNVATGQVTSAAPAPLPVSRTSRPSLPLKPQDPPPPVGHAKAPSPSSSGCSSPVGAAAPLPRQQQMAILSQQLQQQRRRSSGTPPANNRPATPPKPPRVPSPPADDDNSAWLRHAAEVTQQQLELLQQQLGVAQTAETPPQPPLMRRHSASSGATSDLPPSLPAKFGRRAKPAPQQAPPPPIGAPSRRPHSMPPAKAPEKRVVIGGAEPVPEQPSYSPYTLSDYRKINQPIKLGGLGPDDSEEKQFLREQKERARKYAEDIKAVNSAASAAQVAARGKLPITRQPTQQQKEAAEKRKKALDFAANVPKPRVKEASSPTGNTDPHHFEVPTNHELEIAALEAQHKRDKEAVADIKRQLGLC